MTQPTAKVRVMMLQRDGYRCVATGRTDSLTHQHRRASGMGGSKIRPAITDSLTLSAEINDRCERDLQTMALAYGWKVRRWVKDPALVPVFYPWTIRWAVLTDDGGVVAISAGHAAQMMRSVYGEQWDQWMEEIGCETPNGLAETERSEAQ